MVDEDGKKMQKRENLKEKCELCIKEGDSSNNSWNELIDMIKSF